MECIALLYFAFKSDYDYVYYWGLTHKRLYGFAVVSWLSGIFALMAFKISKMKATVGFLNIGVVFTFSLFGIINLVNFDYLIYRVNQPSESQGIAYGYLSELSSDSGSFRDQYKVIVDLDKNEPLKKDAANNIDKQIYYLQNKYGNSKPDWRAFNFSEYEEYKQIKDLKLE